MRWYLDHPAKTKKGKYAPLTPDQKLSTAEKRRILLNNIYGVDIDTQAVEVTKLSLLLKSMEGETEASLKQQLDLYHERILPNLDDNIKCGNSLIGPDYYDVKGALIKDERDDSTIRPFDWKEEFQQVFQQSGFDVVIGNPPYVRQELLGKSKNYFSAKYEVYDGVADLYSYFIEKGIGLLSNKGLFGFIVANKWMRANYGEKLRRWLKQCGIISIIDFGDLPVFTGATTYPCILICEKKSREKLFVTDVKTLAFDKLENYVQQNQLQIDKSSLNDEGWNLSGEREQNLIAKINQQGIALAKYVGGKIYRGVLTGLNEAFVIDEKTKQRLINENVRSKEIIRPFLAGRDIKRYAPPNSNQFLIFSRRGIAIDKYPAIKNYLLQFKTQLVPKPENFKGSNWKGRKPGAYKWYELQDSIDYYPEFEKPKLMLPDIALRCQATYDDANFYCVNTAYIIPVSDKYLLGILNSSLIHFCYTKISTSIRGNYFRFIRQYLEILPIKKITASNKKEKSLHDYVVKYVDQLLDLNKQLHETKLQSKQEELQRRIAHAENKVDELVYELYGLNKEEIEIVENAVASN